MSSATLTIDNAQNLVKDSVQLNKSSDSSELATEISTSSTADCDNAACVRSDEYYLDSITFRVENTLFKVPRYRFIIDSTAFGAMFSLPGQIEPEGLSDDKPIVLPDVSPTEFTRFLRVLYPLSHSQDPGTSCDEWTSVLRLATLWGFDKIRSAAIDRMNNLVSDLPTVDKISLAHRYSVENWFMDGLNELVVRGPSISDDEAAKLGWKWTMRLFREREACLMNGNHRNNRNNNCNYCGGGWSGTMGKVGTGEVRCSQSHLVSLRQAFEEEIKTIKYDASDVEETVVEAMPTKKKKRKVGASVMRS